MVSTLIFILKDGLTNTKTVLFLKFYISVIISVLIKFIFLIIFTKSSFLSITIFSSEDVQSTVYSFSITEILDTILETETSSAVNKSPL